MRKLLFCSALFLLMSACGNDEIRENAPDIPPVPPVIIAEDPGFANDLPVTEPFEEPDPLEAGIPPFNEYFISLDFEPETRTIRGMERVIYTNRHDAALSELVFRVPLNAAGYALMDISHVSQDNEELPFSLDETVLTIVLIRPLEPNETIQLRIQFETSIPPAAHRTGSNAYAVWGGAFLPVEAVFGEGGWHTEPFYQVGNPFLLDVASYTVEITTPLGYIVAGSGTKTETDLDNHKVTTFTAHMSRDFAFAISPYFRRASQVTPSGVEISLYHYTPDLPTEHILNAAMETIMFFEETVGAYPHSHLGIVETDMFRNGVHFSSVIFMESNHLRTSSNLTSLRNEIGRQWFSVIIGSNPVEEPWLNAGLAHFLHEGLLGQPQELRDMIERSHRDLVSNPIQNENIRRIATSLSHYESWIEYFRIQHRKAQIMFYALYREMGEENFKDLLREYYRQFAFRIAASTDFISLAEEIHGSSLGDFFDYWLNAEELPELPAR